MKKVKILQVLYRTCAINVHAFGIAKQITGGKEMTGRNIVQYILRKNLSQNLNKIIITKVKSKRWLERW